MNNKGLTYIQQGCYKMICYKISMDKGTSERGGLQEGVGYM
jgi:hypothetical protein